MKIKMAPATGCPVPQFVVYPETDEDRLLLAAFVSFPGAAKEEWVFKFHGACYSNGTITSFNFGWDHTDGYWVARNAERAADASAPEALS